MDPVWDLPHKELASLFELARLTVSMVVSLERMQVLLMTAQHTRVTKFRRNMKCFAQETQSFVQRVSLMCRYELGDRVNAKLGPGVSLVTTEVRLKHLVIASDEEKRFVVADGCGAIFWLATVKEASASGQLPPPAPASEPRPKRKRELRQRATEAKLPESGTFNGVGEQKQSDPVFWRSRVRVEFLLR